MAYTFWHSGILIGESELAPDPDEVRHLAGTFRPTAYGLELFPRLTGILSAGHQLTTYLEGEGLSADDMEAEDVERVFETTPAGRKIIDIGRALSAVEMRAPSGERIEFTSIGFSDLAELRSLMRDMDLAEKHDLDDLPDGAPRYIVSATIRDDALPRDEELFPTPPEPQWPADN